MTRRAGNKKKVDTCELYRRVLKMPHLTHKEIDEMRRPIILLAQTICEHVWGKKFY